ncbi:MAG: recombination-associated protein RdgC [Myxococcaceae bacterium]|nr:recombination-associated protein RdgC [Myxococcaceae bacterium]
MPILRGSVTFSRFGVETEKHAPSDVRRWLLKGLQRQAFQPIDRKSDDERAAGFVELENPDGTGFPTSALFFGERALFSWRIDTLKVPGAQLKAEMEKWKTAFEREHGRRPSRAEVSEHRGAVRQMLRSKATPITRTHDLSWNLKTHTLQIWTSSRKVVEEIAVALEESFGARLRPLTPNAKAEEGALSPTPELMGVELSPQEVARGEA